MSAGRTSISTFHLFEALSVGERRDGKEDGGMEGVWCGVCVWGGGEGG